MSDLMILENEAVDNIPALTVGMVALYQLREGLEIYATIQAHDEALDWYYIEYSFGGLRFWQWVTDRVLR